MWHDQIIAGILNSKVYMNIKLIECVVNTLEIGKRTNTKSQLF